MNLIGKVITLKDGTRGQVLGQLLNGEYLLESLNGLQGNRSFRYKDIFSVRSL